MTEHDLSIEDVNAINELLSRGAPSGDGSAAWEERKRIANLQWKMTFLGQKIEQSARPASVPPAPQNEEVIEIDEDGRVLYPCGCRATPGAKPAPMHCPIHNRPASVPPAQENEEPEGHPQ